MAYLIFALSVLSRFFPHPWNFSPVFGALLFGGAHIKQRDSIWFPVATLALSDYIMAVHLYGQSMSILHIFVWSGFAFIALLGNWLRRKITVSRFFIAALAGPTVFFFVSNFGVWLGLKTFPPTWQGLLACYIAGLPLYRNSLIASVLFGGVLFGLYHWYERRRESQQVRVIA